MIVNFKIYKINRDVHGQVDLNINVNKKNKKMFKMIEEFRKNLLNK
jgi:hypothetical protein